MLIIIRVKHQNAWLGLETPNLQSLDWECRKTSLTLLVSGGVCELRVQVPAREAPGCREREGAEDHGTLILGGKGGLGPTRSQMVITKDDEEIVPPGLALVWFPGT